MTLVRMSGSSTRLAVPGKSVQLWRYWFRKRKLVPKYGESRLVSSRSGSIGPKPLGCLTRGFSGHRHYCPLSSRTALAYPPADYGTCLKNWSCQSSEVRNRCSWLGSGGNFEKPGKTFLRNALRSAEPTGELVMSRNRNLAKWKVKVLLIWNTRIPETRNKNIFLQRDVGVFALPDMTWESWRNEMIRTMSHKDLRKQTSALLEKSSTRTLCFGSILLRNWNDMNMLTNLQAVLH